MKKILMTGANLSNNFGGPSILIGISKCLRKAIPDVELKIISGKEKSPEQALRYEKKYNIDRVTGIRVRHKYLGLIQAFLWRVVNIIGLRLPSFMMKNPWLDEIRNVDAVMDIRGISQTDFFSDWRTHFNENMILLTAVYLGKPAIKYTQDMGPFLNFSNRIIAKYCFRKYALIIARGIIVRELLKEIGISKNVKVLPDTAFLLDPASEKEIGVILKDEKMQGRPLIGIAASRQVDRRILNDGDKTQQNEYTDALAKMADHLIKEYQASVIFIPNEGAKIEDYDDIYVARKVLDIMMHKENAWVLPEFFNAEITKGLIAKCDLIIASRYHSVVASFSTHIPTMVLGWGFKYDQLTEMVGQRRYLFNYENIDSKEMISSINSLWKNRKAVKEDLERIIPKIKRSVYKGGYYIKEILEKSPSIKNRSSKD